MRFFEHGKALPVHAMMSMEVHAGRLPSMPKYRKDSWRSEWHDVPNRGLWVLTGGGDPDSERDGKSLSSRVGTAAWT